MKHRTHRREFLAVTAGGAWLASGRGAMAAPAQAAAWSDEFPRLLGRIQAPVFAKRDFDITKYGAKQRAEADSSEAIAKAIDACNRAGGGRVVVPAGIFYTGA